ncbi:uncharacterized protein LOC116192369 [Punica granatum]|uniref:DUF7356 domain-containing protein n=2 Tax=Punica granatum TaxID=22663 RepID=A0A218XB93_PUNGR|nr:uncharacterized protein LOC116192369 [Punica granatum]OWM81622.1 hypothetical protein CDL15_Pgr007660 [Punica granatum]PKI40957.1 hypothetical protein CRG98_038485 [Punica granatum]
MGKNGSISVLFVFLLITDVSSTNFDLNIRKLAASEPANNSAPAQVPPLPNPVPSADKSDSIAIDKSSGNSSKDVAKKPPSSDNASPNITVSTGPQTSDQTDNKSNNEKKDNSKKSSPPQGEQSDKKPSPPQREETKKKASPPQGKETNKKLSPPEAKEIHQKLSPPEAKEIDRKVSPPEAKEIDKKTSSPTGVLENCDGKGRKCQIQSTFTGCIRNFDSDSKELEILVQNDGQENLSVNLRVPTSAKDDKENVEVPNHRITKINISNVIGKASKIVLSTGNKACEIDIGFHLPEENVPFHLPTTEELLTPINGAYFLIITVITFGGVWACCKFTKRRRHGSVAYQELEMASPETVSAANVETAEGWDQGWDDDWDEENSVKSPVVRLHAGNISANGLTARPTNRDGWENDWNN